MAMAGRAINLTCVSRNDPIQSQAPTAADPSVFLGGWTHSSWQIRADCSVQLFGSIVSWGAERENLKALNVRASLGRVLLGER